jgi:hypothetical protein
MVKFQAVILKHLNRKKIQNLGNLESPNNNVHLNQENLANLEKKDS